MITLELPRSDGRERVLFVTDRLMAELNGGPWDAGQVKTMFCAGEHEFEGGHPFRVVDDAIPDDAVISAPERVETGLLWKYSVISDAFTDEQPLNLLPKCERVGSR